MRRSGSRDVLVIALVVVAFDVLIGIATFRRVADTGREDLWAMQAMNRIRQGYVRVAPGSGPFLTAGMFDDMPSVMRSYWFTEPSNSTIVGNLVGPRRPPGSPGQPPAPNRRATRTRRGS